MQNTAAILPEKWARAVSLSVLFLSITLFAYTGEYVAIVLPFGFLFALIMGVNWKLAYFILLFTIPVSVDITFFGDKLSTSLPDEPIMWMFLLLFPLLLAKNPKLLPAYWWRNPLVLVIILQYIWMCVTIIYSRELVLSVKFMMAKTWFLVSFFILPIFIFNEKKDFKKAYYLVLIPLLVTMIIINIRHAMLGFHFRKVEKAIGEIYYNHVDYSTLMSMILPLVFTAYVLSKGKNPVVRGLALILLIAFLPAIYLTFARAALVAVVFAIVIAIAIRIRLVNLVMPVFYAMIALVMVYMVRDNKFMDFKPDYERTYMHKHFTDHMIATFRGQDMSSMERLYRWIAAVRMSQDEPITGYGPNAFYYYYKPYAVASFKTYVSRNPEGSTTHNYFLYMLTEQGWPAMILYAILVMVIFAQAQKIYHRFKDKFYKNVTMGIVMMLAAGFINNFFSELLETHKVGSLFYIGVALLVVLDHKSRKMQEEEQAVVIP
jgi:O-antigen ligase